MADQPNRNQSADTHYIPSTSVQRPSLADYSRKYAATFEFERSDGVLTVRLATAGGTGGRSGWFEVWSQVWLDVGNDPDNEVVIITGTGDRWIEMVDDILPDDAETTPETKARRRQPRTPRSAYDSYFGSLKNTENLIFGINVPTIGLINGPAAIHFEFALLCDITLCSEDALFRDPHCQWGIAPGDGLGLSFQEFLGPKRAAYYLYTGDSITAQQAMTFGLVNEVHPREELIPRAHQIAAQILKMPTLGRLMAKQIIRRRLQQRHVNDAAFHIAHEMLGLALDAPAGGAMTPEMRQEAADRWEASIQTTR